MKNLEVESFNSVTIIGKPVSTTIRTGQTSTGKPYESVNVIVRVEQDIEGKNSIHEIPVGFFASPYTNGGKENPMYRNIQTLKELKTIQSHGVNGADTVRLTKANLRENFFVARSGQLIDGWQLRGAFCSTVKEGAKETATFNVDVFILDMKDEVNAEGDTTGRFIIKGAVVQYGGTIDVFDFIVEAPDKADYLQRTLEVGQTMRLGGHIRFTTEEVQRPATMSSWGENIEGDSTRTIRELIVTGGADEPYDEEFGYDPVEIKKALNARKAKIEQAQIEAKNGGQKKAESKPATKYDWE